MLRYGALIAVAFAAFPANAQQMNATEARSFVVGKLFSYVCFEGTRGAGRIADNGSVGGTIQFRGQGATRFAVLPQNTLRTVGDRVCASVKGVPFEPCFNLVKTGHNSFRGSVSGLGFAYCDFVRRDRPLVAAAQSRLRQQARAEASEAPAQPESAPAEVKDAPKAKESGSDEPLELRPSTR